MNDLPCDWATELQEAYPDRSGINGWGSVRLLLALRTALQNDPWERIIDGCKRYKTYCQKTGIEGSVYVQAPYRFISEQSYLETFEHKAPEDPRISAHKAQEADRWARASELGAQLSIDRYPHDSIDAYESRIRTAQSGINTDRSASQPSRAVSARISDLTARMRIAK